MIVIVKNYSNEPIMIDDLGIDIPSNAQINLSELFSFFEIMSSNDLKDLVYNNNLTINDGNEDLNSNEGKDYITF